MQEVGDLSTGEPMLPEFAYRRSRNDFEATTSSGSSTVTEYNRYYHMKVRFLIIFHCMYYRVIDSVQSLCKCARYIKLYFIVEIYIKLNPIAVYIFQNITV